MKVDATDATAKSLTARAELNFAEPVADVVLELWERVPAFIGHRPWHEIWESHERNPRWFRANNLD